MPIKIVYDGENSEWLGKGTRKRVARNALGTYCPYCNRIMGGERGNPLYPSIDHIDPRAYGGTNARANCLVCCAQCNHDKRQLRLTWWLELLEETNDPRAQFVRPIVEQRAAANLQLTQNCSMSAPRAE